MRKVILFTLAALSISGCKKKEELPLPSQETCSSEWMSQHLSKFTIEQQNHFRKACKAISEKDQTIKQAPKATPKTTTGVAPASTEKTPTKTLEAKPEENVKPTTTPSSSVPPTPQTTDQQGKVTAPIASSASNPSTK